MNLLKNDDMGTMYTEHTDMETTGMLKKKVSILLMALRGW